MIDDVYIQDLLDSLREEDDYDDDKSDYSRGYKHGREDIVKVIEKFIEDLSEDDWRYTNHFPIPCDDGWFWGQWMPIDKDDDNILIEPVMIKDGKWQSETPPDYWRELNGPRPKTPAWEVPFKSSKR